MNSTKRYLPMLAVVCVLFLTATLSAQNATQEFDSTIGGTNPCNGSAIQVQGPTTIDYHVNLPGDSAHVVVHVQTRASGQDATGNSYQTNFEANGQFDALATNDSPYQVPFHSVWIGPAGAPNFKLDGTISVFVTDGTLSGAMITGVDSLSCTN